MARLVAAGVTLRKQIDQTFPGRDKGADGWIASAEHRRRSPVSDHNPDANGWVHALDIDADLIPWNPAASRKAAQHLVNELVQYAASGALGSHRIKYVVFNDRIASGTYAKTWWQWRGNGYGHFGHIHISFTGENRRTGRRKFPLPILRRGKR